MELHHKEMNPFFKIHEYVKNIKKAESGFAKHIPELFEKLIKIQFENTETIIKIHNSLIDYISSPEAIFFIRKYGSYKKDKYHLQRRGFMSEYPNKIKTVFCDNTFTEIFSAMKLCNISFTVNDLHNLFNQENLVVGFQDVSEERELSFYNNRKSKKIYLTNKGWYTAHIKAAGENKSFDGYSINEFFPNPDRIEYKNERKIRVVKKDLNEIELKILKAHFLRLIHPFNSFLSPAKKITRYELGNIVYEKGMIGEEKELLSYVRDYIKGQFPKEYKEFDKLSLDYELNYDSKIKNITWDINKKIKKEQSKVSSKKEKKIENKKHTRELKIGAYIKSVFSEFFEKSMLSPLEIENLKDPTYSKETFSLKSNGVAILRDIKEGVEVKTKLGSSHKRYWKDVFGGKYHVYSQWYDNEQYKTQRESFKKWEVRIRN